MDFYRKKLLPEDFFGLDTIQGHLEFARYYENGKYMKLSASSEDDGRGIPVLKRLKEEGYLNLEFSPRDDGGITLEKVSLTVAGYKLLEELSEKSLSKRISNRLKNTIWSVATTTLIVLWLKS